MGYSQPMNFNVEIPEDLNAIPNSKMRPRQKSSMNAYKYDEERKIKNSLRFKSPPDKKSKAYLMNYLTLPSFNFTITQMPKENIPLCGEWFYYEIDLNNLADYNPLTMNNYNKI